MWTAHTSPHRTGPRTRASSFGLMSASALSATHCVRRTGPRGQFPMETTRMSYGGWPPAAVARADRTTPLMANWANMQHASRGRFLPSGADSQFISSFRAESRQRSAIPASSRILACPALRRNQSSTPGPNAIVCTPLTGVRMIMIMIVLAAKLAPAGTRPYPIPFSHINAAKSATRQAYPHSLSYQEMIFTMSPPTTWVERPSTIDERGSCR